MSTAQIQLQDALTTTFLANLSFLSIYDKELYLKIDELSRMIGDGRYEEKYALDFLEENGEFDIYDIVNKKYLYKKKPKKFNNSLINTKSEISFFNSLLFKKEEDINRIELIDNLQDGVSATKLFNKDFQEYVNILKINPYTDKKDVKKNDKFLFIGTLCGRHIPQIVKDVDASSYFICESNLEIFRLSLFTVDYTVLTQRKGAVFSIMDDEDTFIKKINSFLIHDSFFNHKIKYSTTNINVNTYFESIFSSIVRRDPMIFNHYMLQDCILRNFANRASIHKILNFKEIEKNLMFLKNKPVLYICAGPSLGENIEWIKKNKDKFLIISIGASFEKLFDNGIASDIIVTLDSQRLVFDNQFNKKSFPKYKNSIILASTMTEESVLNQFDNSKLFLYEVMYPFFENKIFDAFSVGEMGLSILLNFNFQDIYMIGTDLALNQNTGSTHSEDYKSGSTLDISDISNSTSMNNNTFGFRGDLIKVRGNLKDEVITSRIFESSIHCYNSNIKKTKKEFQTIYNLSTHGAFIQDTVSFYPYDLDLNSYPNIMEKEEIRDKLLIELNNLSSTTFPIEKINNMLDEIEYIDNIIFDIEKLNKKKYSNYEDLYKDFLTITERLLKSEGRISLGTEIFTKYFTLVLPYINYCFNDKKEIKALHSRLDEIKSIFYRQVIDLISRYNKYLIKMSLNKET